MKKSARAAFGRANAAPVSYPVEMCERCGKYKYETRKAAKIAAKRRAPGEHTNAYACPGGGWHPDGGWHWGHLPSNLRQGKVSRTIFKKG